MSGDGHPVADVILREEKADEIVSAFQNNDQTSLVSSLSERSDDVAECGQYMARNLADERLGSTSVNVVADCEEERRMAGKNHELQASGAEMVYQGRQELLGSVENADEEQRNVLTGKDQELQAFGTKMVYRDQELFSGVENAAEEHQTTAEIPTEVSHQQHRCSLITNGDNYAIDHSGDNLATEPADTMPHHHHQASGDAGVNHDVAHVPQPSSPVMTFEHTSYKDDFATEASDDHVTQSPTDLRFV